MPQIKLLLALLLAQVAYSQFTPPSGGGGSGSGSGVIYCAPASSSATVYTCTPSPAITAYATGMTLAFVPDVTSGSAPTVNVNAKGAVNIKMADGSIAPAPGVFVAGGVYLLVNDGTNFRWSASNQPSSLCGGGGSCFQRAVECNTGSVSLSGGTFTYPGGTVAASGTSPQEFVIVTGLTGNQEYTSVQISEHTQFTQGASITALKASIGRPGNSTNDELLAQTALMVSGSDAWYAYDRPQPPILTGSYTLVLALRTTGGVPSSLTAGQVNYKVCGWSNQ